VSFGQSVQYSVHNEYCTAASFPSAAYDHYNDHYHDDCDDGDDNVMMMMMMMMMMMIKIMR
jgi:hypothetical protein